MKSVRMIACATIAATAFAAACAKAPGNAPVDVAAETAAIKSMVESANAAYVACDIASVATHEVAGATGYYPESTALMVSNDEERQKEDDFCKAGGKNELTENIAGVEVLGDVGYVLGSGHYKRTEPDGKVSIDGDYTATHIVVKSADGWKFKHSHIGAVLAMPEAAALPAQP